ncbi:hypothetical protein Tco_0168981 [Tanacetum coccineum]
MVELEVPLKKKDQLALDEEMARNLDAQLQDELIEEERISRQKEEEANIALLKSWDNTQALMEAKNFELAQRLQAEEQEEITIEERSRLKRISEKRTKNQAKTDKTEHGMEKRGKDKVKSKPKSTKVKVKKVKVKVNPEKSKVKSEAVIEEYLMGPPEPI